MESTRPMRKGPIRAPFPLFAALLLGILATTGCRNVGHSAESNPRKVVDLSPIVSEDLAARQVGVRAAEFLGLAPRLTFREVIPARENQAYGISVFEVPSHVGSHLDAPSRLLKGGQSPDEVPLDRLFGRARLLDLRWKDRNSPLQITDLENYTIEADDIVLLFVGYTPPQGDDWPLYSSLSAQAAHWLAGKKIRALATDMPSLGNFQRYADLMDRDRPPEEVWAPTLPLFNAGIPVIEGLVNMGQLVDEESIVFAGFPLKVAQSSGAPVRAVALVY